MAAPTYFGSATSPSDGGTQNEPVTAAVTPPGSMSSGQLVIMVGQMQVATAGQITLSATGGQTWDGPHVVTGANDQVMALWWCQYNGTWSADPSLAFAAQSGTQAASVTLHVFTPDAAATWRVDVAISGGSEASQDPMVVTEPIPTKRDNVSLAAIFVTGQPTVASVSGSGWTLVSTNQYRNIAGTDQTSSFAYRLQSTPAATADASFDLSASASGISFAMVWYNDRAPTIALDTEDAHDFGADTTPTVEFTGTDGNADDVRYQIQIDSSSGFDSQTGTPLEYDNYSESNNDGAAAVLSGQAGVSQSFQTNVSGKLVQVKFYLSKSSGASGNATAKIYAHSGTFGTSSIPTGSALATSDTLDVSTLTTSLALVTMAFTGAQQITLSASTNYVLTFEYSGATQVNVGRDISNPTHAGNNSQLVSSTWTPDSTRDAVFYLYVASPLLNKLSGTDSGFANTVTGGDTDPFNSGEKASFTVQAGDALAGGTWYWRARAKDPNGGNTWGSWAAARSFTISTDTTTTKTQLGKAAIRVSQPRTQLGKAAVRVTQPRTQAGVSRIRITTPQTTAGKSRMQISTPQAQLGKAAVQNTTAQTQQGRGRLQTTASGTQQGISRLNQQVAQTEPGVSRIQVTTPRTQDGRGRIQKTASSTQDGKAKITQQASQPQLGRSRIHATSTQNALGKAAIQNTTPQPQPGRGRIQTTVSTGQPGQSRLQRTASATQDGRSRMTATAPQTIAGKSRMMATASAAQLGRARLMATASADQLGVSKISVPGSTAQTQLGKAAIQKSTGQTQLGIGRVQKTASATQDGKGRIEQVVGAAQMGKARLTNTAAVNQQGQARLTATGSQVQTGKSRLQRTSSVLQTGQADISRTTEQSSLGKSAIAISNTQDQVGISRVEVIQIRNISGLSLITGRTIRNMLGRARIAAAFGEPDPRRYLPVAFEGRNAAVAGENRRFEVPAEDMTENP